MFLSRPSRPIHRIRAVLFGSVVAVAATAIPLGVAGASTASSASTPSGGTIHIYLINTSLSPTAPTKVLITGAFSDHGTGKHGLWHLTKGTITVDSSKIKAITSSPSFGTFYAKSCSFDGVATADTPIVSGTGAYAGIHGSVNATVTQAAQFPLLTNGKCNESDNAPALAEDLIVTGSGKVSL